MSSKHWGPLDQKHRPAFLSSFFRGRLLRFLGFKAAMLRIGSLVLILGFLAVIAGLYSALQNGGDDDVFPTVTIFAAPHPFSYSGGRLDLGGGRQELAVRSWLALAHDVNVVLFGKDSSIFELASSLGPRVTVETGIDFSVCQFSRIHFHQEILASTTATLAPTVSRESQKSSPG